MEMAIKSRIGLMAAVAVTAALATGSPARADSCSSTPLAKVYWGDDWIPVLCTGTTSLNGESQAPVTRIEASTWTGYYTTLTTPAQTVPFCGDVVVNQYLSQVYLSPTPVSECS
jgi:hypothetical protein